MFVNTVLATGEGTGAVSWLNYAFRLMYLPLGIFGVSIATAAMPGIARHAAREDIPGMRHEVASGIAMMAVLNVPATLGLIVLARPIVAMLFERGAFTPRDTDATAAALDVLRDRADRLLGREGRVADVLRAAREPQARHGQRRQRARERRRSISRSSSASATWASRSARR